MIAAQQTTATDLEISGLPADVVANLAREALNGSPENSEAALAALTTLTTDASWGQQVVEAASGVFEYVYGFALQHFSLHYAAALLVGFVLLIVCGWFLRSRAAQVAPAGHEQTPHRIAYAEAVTMAAQMLSKGEAPHTVAKASGLARDLVSVVGSRRLIPAPVTQAPRVGGATSYAAGSYAAAESSSGQKTRGTAATQRGRILK